MLALQDGGNPITAQLGDNGGGGGWVVLERGIGGQAIVIGDGSGSGEWSGKGWRESEREGGEEGRYQ